MTYQVVADPAGAPDAIIATPTATSARTSSASSSWTGNSRTNASSGAKPFERWASR